MQRLRYDDPSFPVVWAAICRREARAVEGVTEAGAAEVMSTTSAIVDDVARRGDQALLEYTRTLDRWDPEAGPLLEIPRQRLEAAWKGLAPVLREALEIAIRRVRSYHEKQAPRAWMGELEPGDGLRVGWRLVPLARAGVYVPGGRAAYPSSVVMNVVPARVAGVEEVVAVSPAPGGELNQAVLAAAHATGVDRFFALGGAQAIAALAFGSETVPRCDVIVGPGNAYVAAAKRLVMGQAAVDSEAGPSEVLVVADAAANPEYVAADLLAQAEHDERALAGLLAVAAPDLAGAVLGALERRLACTPRAEIAAAALERRGFVVEVPDRETALRLANTFAPEHLELLVESPAELATGVRSAGAVFLGPWSPEALGDYAAGPNHVLPTAATARFASPLGVWTFMRTMSVIEAQEQGMRALAPTVRALAEAEGLFAHWQAIEARLHSADSVAQAQDEG